MPNSFFFIFSFILSISLCTYFFFNPEITGPLWDVSIFRYIGMLICKGGVPYKDVFDHKPPIIYFLYAFGHLISYKWGVFILFLLINILTNTLLLKLFSKNQIFWTYSLCFLLNTLILYFSNEIAYIDIFTTRYLVMYLILIFCIISLILRDEKYLFFSAGAFLSSIFLVQTNEVLPAFVFVCFMFIYKNVLGKIFTNIAHIVMGAGIVIIPIALYLLFNNAINEFIYQAFKFNFETYIPIHDDTVWNRLKNTYSAMQNFNLHYILWVSGATGLIFLAEKRNLLGLNFLVFFVVIFLLQLYTTGLSNNNYGHYFFPFVAYFISFLIVYFKELSIRNSFSIKRFTLTFSMGLYFLCVVYVIKNSKPFEKFSEKKFDTAFTEIENSIPFETLSNKNGTFFSWEVGNYITLNAKYNIIAPTKWVYSNGLIAQYMAKRNIEEFIINDIEQQQTIYILTYQLPEYSKRKKLLQKNYQSEYYKNVGINIWQKR